MASGETSRSLSAPQGVASMTELEVWWDGSHTGHDEDHLLTPRIPDKRQGTPTEIQERFLRLAQGGKGAQPPQAVQHAILRLLLRQALSHVELAEALSLSRQCVSTALHGLIRHRRIHAEPIPPAERRYGLRKRYRLGEK